MLLDNINDLPYTLPMPRAVIVSVLHRALRKASWSFRRSLAMLVLSRKRDEKILITLPDGRLVEIMVVDIQGDKVRLGIEAPKEVPVHRQEVYEAIQKKQNVPVASTKN